MKRKTLQVDIMKMNEEKKKYEYWKKYRYDMPIPRVGEILFDAKENKLLEVDRVLYEPANKAIGIYVSKFI